MRGKKRGGGGGAGGGGGGGGGGWIMLAEPMLDTRLSSPSTGLPATVMKGGGGGGGVVIMEGAIMDVTEGCCCCWTFWPRRWVSSATWPWSCGSSLNQSDCAGGPIKGTEAQRHKGTKAQRHSVYRTTRIIIIRYCYADQVYVT